MRAKEWKKWVEIRIDTILEFKDMKNSNIKTLTELKEKVSEYKYVKLYLRRYPK